MKIRKILVGVMSMAALGVLHAAELDLEKDFRQEIARYHIRPDQTRSLRRDPDGAPVSEPQLKEAAKGFYDRLYPLDPAFLKRFQIKNVVFKDTVYDREGNTLQRRIVGNDMLLDADLDDKQFYGSLFYMQISLMQRTYLGRWNKLNPDGFEYEQSRGNLSGSAQKKLDAVLAEWDKYFVTRTGMYSTEMDMALTFAYMMAKGPGATAFVKKNSPDVQKKIDLIVEILESVKAVEHGYMQTLLVEDLSNLKSYVPYALSVRLEREYSGEWSVPENEDADENPAEAQPVHKIGDPVEVAGHKVNPLILALETKNNRLFNVLMQNKVDPNVANDKKTCALMLAIANNDPEQVKALLKAGAKVTQDAARAGTASGINAEIVKLMNSYLPGVRQSEKTETKKTDRKSGDAASRDAAGNKLSTRLKEISIGHVEYEEVDALSAIQVTLQQHLKTLKSGENGLQISFPPDYKGSPVSIVIDNVSLYELLQLICKSAGLKMRIDGQANMIIFSPNQEQANSGKKTGSMKKKQ